MHQPLAGFIQHRYNLSRQPLIISGEVTGPKRQARVNEFQGANQPGFDVMILSPRAGGVGLTLEGNGGAQSFLLHSPDAVATVSKTTLWQAYGREREGFAIAFSVETTLPWSGEVRLEVI